MKKIIIGAAFLVVTIFFLLILKSAGIISGQTKQKLTIKDEVSLFTIEGDTVTLNYKNYPSKLILNFYGTGCSLCQVEISDIVSFSRDNKINVLFITADSIEAIKQFKNELSKQGINDEHISFAQVRLEDAKRLFGDVIVPQSIVFDKMLTIRASKKGLISYSFLKKSYK